MSKHDDDQSFFNRRSKNAGGGRRNLPPPIQSSSAGGFERDSSYSKKTVKYNPAQCYDIAMKSSSASEAKDKKQQHKTKYVNLYGERGQDRLVMKLPGRNECNCQASAHSLINNCLKCGRVVCEQEGSGPCFFCSALFPTQVYSRDEQKIVDRGGRKAEDLRNQLLLLPLPKPISKKAEQEQQLSNVAEGTEASAKSTNAKGKISSATKDSSFGKDYEKGLEKALAEKDRLLEYQQSSARRTMVYDDESDYFDTNANPWLTAGEKEKLRKREEELRALQNLPRSQRKITLDLATRQVTAEQPLVNLYNPEDAVIQDVFFSGGTTSGTTVDLRISDVDDIHRPGFFRPTYSGDTNGREENPASLVSAKVEGSRLQDSTLQDLSDQGRCLSMHQPYASLLVRGIKKHEGRSWYTTHRGPLWIASTAKQASKDDIKEVEQFYRHYYNDYLPVEFPLTYPSGCLIGCIDVVDCLAQEQYQELYPGGESESPYVWICENPRELSTFFPIRGQHKIYKLDPTIHQAARKIIHKVG